VRVSRELRVTISGGTINQRRTLASEIASNLQSVKLAVEGDPGVAHLRGLFGQIMTDLERTKTPVVVIYNREDT
jgi:hypothetical protein